MMPGGGGASGGQLRMKTTILVALALAAAAPVVALPPPEAYGTLPSVDLITLSPDGSLMALATGPAKARRVDIRRTSDRALVQSLPVGTAKVRDLSWAGDHHLILTRSTTAQVTGLTGPKREWLLAIDVDLARHRTRPLLEGVGNGDVETMNTVGAVPEIRMIEGKPFAFATGFSFPSGTGVRTLFRADLDGRATKVAATGNENTEGFLIDAAGTIVARSDYIERNGHWLLWTRRGGSLVKSMEASDLIDSPSLIGFGRTPGTAIVETRVDDDWGYREVAFGGEPSAPLAEMAGASLVRDPVSHLVIGTVRQDGLKVDYTFFGTEDQKLWRGVAKAFPGSVVRVEAWSDDRKKLVLRVEGGAVGAAFYLLDVGTKRAEFLNDEYDGIGPEDIGAVKAIEYKAADGLAIPAFLTLPPGRAAKNLPLVVLPHGGPGAHDDAGFDWLSQAIASRGYAVLQPQFRGSTGFGEPFHAAGWGEWGRKMQTDLSDGVAFLAHDGTIDPKRVCIVGGSYGGYAALAGVTLQHGIYACAVSLAGPSDLRAMLSYEADISNGSQNSTLRFWQRFMGAKSRSDPALDAISPAKLAAKVDVPILLIHGKDDTVVAYDQSKTMAAALARAGYPPEFVTLASEDHWLSRGETRTAMLTATLDFLAKHLPAGTGSAAAAP